MADSESGTQSKVGTIVLGCLGFLGLMIVCGGIANWIDPPEPKAVDVVDATLAEANSSEEEDGSDWPREVIEKESRSGVKYSVTFRLRMVDGKLPTQNVLRAISDGVADFHPGYNRYFVSFLTPSQRIGEGYFATAHRKPDCDVQYHVFLMLDDFHVPESELRAAYLAAGKSPEDGVQARRAMQEQVSNDR